MAHDGISDKRIASELNRTISSVRNKGYRENIKQRKLNINLFEKWSQKNSWLLGLITADGSFDKGYGKENHFGLYNSNYKLLKQFKNILKTENKISQHKTNRLGDKKVWRLFVSNKKIADFLKNINAYGDKDERNPFPLVPDKYKWSFIKGLFDGDGNFYKGTFSIAGRKQLIKFVYYWICQQINKKPNKLYQSSNSNKTYYFQINGKDTMKVLNKILENTNKTYDSSKFNTMVEYFANKKE